MSETKSYKLFESREDEFYLKPCTFGVYEKVKLAQLKCTAVPELTKQAIIKEFNLSESEVGDKAEYGLKGLYEFILRNIFIEPPKNIKMDDLAIGELNRASQDFFSLATGS